LSGGLYLDLEEKGITLKGKSKGRQEKILERKYLNPKEFEEIYRIPEKTLANWRSQGRGPAYFKFGGKVRYSLKDIEDWIEKSRFLTIDSPN